MLTRAKWKNIRYDLLMYVTNHVIAHIPSHSLRLAYYRRVMAYEIGARSVIFMQAWFDTRGQFRLGNGSVVNEKCRLDSRGGLSIGDNVSLSAEVCILTAEHDLYAPDFTGRTRPVHIGNYVFVGTRALILPGVRIGEGAAIAAGAVVTRDVAPYCIVAGIPARPIGTRPENLNYSTEYARWFS